MAFSTSVFSFQATDNSTYNNGDYWGVQQGCLSISLSKYRVATSQDYAVPYSWIVIGY